MSDTATKANKYYFSTRDLLIIAVLGAMGGAFSVYMGYLIAEAYNAIRVWFPVAESLSGVHLIWIVLVIAITNKKGSGVLAGLLKGSIEFLMGSRLGLFVILLSLVEGLFAEIGFWPFRKYRRLSYLLAGGLGTASNVVAFQFFVPFNSPLLFGLATFMAFLSGVVIAGIFGLGVTDSLEEAGIIKKAKDGKKGLRLTATKVAAVLIALSIVIVAGAVVFKPPEAGTSPTPAGNVTPPAEGKSMLFTISGSVDQPGDYDYYSYSDRFVIMESQAIGNPHKPQTYTGLQLKTALQDAGLQPGATKVDVIGYDGYYNTFEISQAIRDDVLLVDVGGQLKIIANSTSQEYWVGMIKTVKVY
ncbi:ECF transporter S component [Methanocella sp. MCL-LM]|uniref:ECF transporter S component n=1 Tax=Methanocella sp. MCL-LM TaxID=3412035 RepID=UPI003C740D86